MYSSYSAGWYGIAAGTILLVFTRTILTRLNTWRDPDFFSQSKRISSLAFTYISRRTEVIVKNIIINVEYKSGKYIKYIFEIWTKIDDKKKINIRV